MNGFTTDASSTAIYLHWPFCRKKCPYCDFNSHVREGVDHAKWREALRRELRYWREASAATRVSSVFFGGGTPSLMEPATVGALLEDIHTLWDAEGCEITLEANPTSVEAEKFRDLKAAGVNRVSLGIQSLRQESLEFLGREHSVREALHALELAHRHFPRVSFDLIYALPNQTEADWAAELAEALTYAQGHLSLYQLTIEENTAFHHAYYAQKQFDLPAEPTAIALYRHTNTRMGEAGLPAYEISNYAAAGQESQHNLTYWRSGAYLGVGAGAHGRVMTHAGERLATRNLKSPERWIAGVTDGGHGAEEVLTLTPEERMEEAVLMGLRLVQQGCDLAALPQEARAAFADRVADGRLEKLVALELLTQEGDQLRMTEQGQLVLNRVIEEILG